MDSEEKARRYSALKESITKRQRENLIPSFGTDANRCYGIFFSPDSTERMKKQFVIGVVKNMSSLLELGFLAHRQDLITEINNKLAIIKEWQEHGHETALTNEEVDVLRSILNKIHSSLI